MFNVYSFDSAVFTSSNRCGNENGASPSDQGCSTMTTDGAVPPAATAASATGRRGSFLLRSSDSFSDLSPMSISRKLSSAEALVFLDFNQLINQAINRAIDRSISQPNNYFKA